MLYTLDELDVRQVNRRRTTPKEIALRILKSAWPLGAQAHVGLDVILGQTFPMLIVAVGKTSDVIEWVNGQVFLDGTDVLWKAGLDVAAEAPAPGRWHWPERV